MLGRRETVPDYNVFRKSSGGKRVIQSVSAGFVNRKCGMTHGVSSPWMMPAEGRSSSDAGVDFGQSRFIEFV
jgi:hypothetical protein